LWRDANPIPPWDFRHGTSASPAAVNSLATMPAGSSTDAVYITTSGTKYHVAGCRFLAKSKFPIALADARKKYGPCSVCNPPR